MVSEWRSSTWGNEVSLEYGKAIRGYSQTNGKYRVFGSNGPIGWNSEALTNGPGVILGRKGAYRGTEFCRESFWVIDTAYYLVPKTTLDMRWLYYAVKHYKLGKVDDGSPIPSTTRAAVYMLDLDVPPLEEQNAIAHILGTLDDKIELNRRRNETLEAMARALFKDWFVDFGPVRAKMQGREPYLAPDIWALFPDKLDEEGKPGGWQSSTVGENFDLLMGQSPPGDTYNGSKDGLPFFQGRTDFGFRYPENRKYCTAPTRIANAEDTLVSVRAPVGDINLAWEKCCIGRGVAAIRHHSGGRSFTYHALWGLQIELKQYEHTGTVFGAINKKQFEALAFVAPPEKIARAFEEVIGKHDDKVRANIMESRTLATLRDTLLPKLLSGELRVGDVEHLAGHAK